MKRAFVASLFVAVAIAFGLNASGASLVQSKPIAKVVTLKTCAAATLGTEVIVGGDSVGDGATRVCICKANGIGLDAGAALDMDAAAVAAHTDAAIVYPYQWCSIKLNHAAAVVCDLGSPTVCP